MASASDGHALILRAYREALRPDQPLWVEQWADDHMIIPPESGAAEPGRYRGARTPYAIDVMHALSPEHPARKVVIKGASQLLKTQVALNWVCSLIDRAPANIIFLEPTGQLARRVASRFDKVVRRVPVLRLKVATQKDRDSKNTSDTKEFKGGTIWFLSARSVSNLAEASVRWLIIDEVDRLLRELKGEGNPIALAEKRLSTFGRKGKGLYISSPTEENASRIDELYREGNQQRYHVPCPHCGELQALEWENLHYDADLDVPEARAWYVCEHHGCIIEEHQKASFLKCESIGGRARWVADAPGNGITWSYTISALYAPLGWVSWLDLAREYVAALTAHQAGDSEDLQTFYNTRLARCWTATATRIQPRALMDQAEAYPLGQSPLKALMLTAAVDVQDNRLEVQITGWGPGLTGLECWIVNTHVLFGNPTLPEIWKELDRLLQTPVRHALGGQQIVRAVAIDSGDGENTQEIYEFCRPRRHRIVCGRRQDLFPIKGASQAKAPIIGRGKKLEYSYRGRAAAGSVELFLIGGELAADWFMNRLALKDAIAVHTSHELPLDFYDQLLAEVKVAEYRKGRKIMAYRPIKRGIRNEQHDLLKYNVALAHYLGLHRFTAQHWEQIERELMQVDLLIGLDQPLVPQTLPPSVSVPTARQDIGPSPNRHQGLMDRLRARR